MEKSGPNPPGYFFGPVVCPCGLVLTHCLAYHVKKVSVKHCIAFFRCLKILGEAGKQEILQQMF